jgi:hypothetical protein
MTLSINKYINYIFYGIVALHVFVLMGLVFSNTTFVKYMDIEDSYTNILYISNLILGISLIFKYFFPIIKAGNLSFLQILKENKLFIGVNIGFFIMLVMNNNIEEQVLTQLQNINQYVLPIHIFIYALAFYFIYTDYSDIYIRCKSLNEPTVADHAKIRSQLIKTTEASVIHFVIIFLGILIAGKKTLALYVLHHINVAFILISTTSFLFFIALYLLYAVKKHRA